MNAATKRVELITRMQDLLSIRMHNKSTWSVMAIVLQQLGDVCHELCRDEDADKYRGWAQRIRIQIGESA